MAIFPIWSLFLFISAHEALQSIEPYGKEGEITYGNFIQNSPKGFILNKTEKLVSNLTTTSIDDCQVECIQHKHCLSINVIPYPPSHYRCELLNWSSTEFSKRLIPTMDSYSMQMEVSNCSTWTILYDLYTMKKYRKLVNYICSDIDYNLGFNRGQIKKKAFHRLMSYS